MLENRMKEGSQSATLEEGENGLIFHCRDIGGSF